MVIRPGRRCLVRDLFTEGNGTLHENYLPYGFVDFGAMHAVAAGEVFVSQGYEIDMLRSSVYTPQKGFEAPSVAGVSKDRTKLIIRVSTQESLLPDDFQARKVQLFDVAKRCELYFERYSPSAGFTKNTRVEFMRSDADGLVRVENLTDEEFLKRMTLAVYENGELICDDLEGQAA